MASDCQLIKQRYTINYLGDYSMTDTARRKVRKMESEIRALTHRLGTCHINNFHKVQEELFKKQKELKIFIAKEE